MDLWQLYIYCKVVEKRSFSEAGKSVRLSQPTVSSHIRDLENHFGCRLIDRLAKAAVPTKEGEILYQYALRLTALKEEAEKALSRFKGTIEGELTIGGSTIPGAYILPGTIGGFLKDHPAVYIRLRVGDTAKIIDDVLSGEVELAVVGARSSDKRLKQKVLVEDEMRLIVPVDHRWYRRSSVTVDMLSRERFILRESGSGTLRSIQENFQQNGLHLKDLCVVSELGSTEAIVQGVKAHIGLSIVSSIAVSEALHNRTLKALRITGLNLKRHFYLTQHKHRSLSPPGQAYASHLTLCSAIKNRLQEF